MEVELPSSGCNILNNATTFYNYNTNNTIRDTYVIYEGKAFKTSSTSNQYGYNYTGDCLSTGSLIYKPELQVYFPLLSIFSFLFILFLIYNIIIKRLLP